MSESLASSVGIAAYLALFASVGVIFLFTNLLLGYFVRPSNPNKEKLEIYECGEPAIGSSFVQFDLRFYVVALLFLIFDVEVAFFFPWAAVFGKTTHLMDERLVVVQRMESGELELTASADGLYRELGVRSPVVPDYRRIPLSLQAKIDPTGDEATIAREISKKGARQLTFFTLADIGVFFAILMVGFFYVWKRGDLDWVRAVSQEKSRKGSASIRGKGLDDVAGGNPPVLSA